MLPLARSPPKAASLCINRKVLTNTDPMRMTRREDMVGPTGHWLLAAGQKRTNDPSGQWPVASWPLLALSFHSHSRLRAGIRGQKENALAVSGGQHHAFAHTEFHLARREIADHDRHTTN